LFSMLLGVWNAFQGLYLLGVMEMDMYQSFGTSVHYLSLSFDGTILATVVFFVLIPLFLYRFPKFNMFMLIITCIACGGAIGMLNEAGVDGTALNHDGLVMILDIVWGCVFFIMAFKNRRGNRNAQNASGRSNATGKMSREEYIQLLSGGRK
jgi:cyanate permease